ncbi:MAG: DUF2807 domain-containing protein [Vicingaceae bacterium]|nr:DUF2807 domain-containing protein [Vicingaceae bacterium]
MKNIIILFITLLIATTVFAQKEVRNFENVNSLKVSLPFNVVLIQGLTEKVEIEGLDSEYLDNIKSEMNNGELSIFTKGKIKSKQEITVSITFKHLKEINLGGALDVSTLDVIRENELKIKGSGAIEADLNIEVPKLSIEFSGASDLKLRGLADTLTLKTSGASDIKASNFIAKNVIIGISGASDAKVYASESIRGTATGASSVNVKGSPAIKAINKSGAASIGPIRRIQNINNGDEVSIVSGKQHINVSDNDDVDVKLGNKEVIVIDDGDTVRLKWGSTQLTVIGDSVEIKRIIKKRRNHWAGIDLAINGFLNSKSGFDLSNDPQQVNIDPEKVTQFMELNYAKSWSFSVNFLEFYIPIKKHNFGIVTGMGTEWSNYELKHNIKLNPEGGEFVHPVVDEFNKNYTWGEVDTVLDYSKNRFKTWFINAPLLLEINTGDNARKAFHISAGAIFGYNLQTKMKYKYRLNGENKKEKDRQDFNTNPFRVSATVRAGYGWFNVFAKYSLTPLFEKGRGPELYPFTVGVTLLGF